MIFNDIGESFIKPRSKDFGQSIANEQCFSMLLYGPPGTGKTYLAERLARHIISGGDGCLEIVQFHPSFRKRVKCHKWEMRGYLPPSPLNKLSKTQQYHILG